MASDAPPYLRLPGAGRKQNQTSSRPRSASPRGSRGRDDDANDNNFGASAGSAERTPEFGPSASEDLGPATTDRTWAPRGSDAGLFGPQFSLFGPQFSTEPSRPRMRTETDDDFGGRTHRTTAWALASERLTQVGTSLGETKKTLTKRVDRAATDWDNFGRILGRTKTFGTLPIVTATDDDRQASMRMSTASQRMSSTFNGISLERNELESPNYTALVTLMSNDGVLDERPGLQQSRASSREITASKEDEVFDLTEDDGLSVPSTIFLMVTAIVGCGVVALPSLMKLGGWVVVPILAGVISLSFIEVGQVIHKAVSLVEENKIPRLAEATDADRKIASFEEFGRAAFGQAGAYTVRTVTTSGFFGTLVVYTILISQNVYDFFGSKLSRQWVLVLVTPLFLALAMLRDLQAMAKIMPIGVFASLSSCLLICVKAGLDARLWQDEPLEVKKDLFTMWPHEFDSLGTIVAVLFAAYSVMGTVPSIRGQMQDRTKFLEAFRIAIGIVFVVYISVMMLGYYGYGNEVKDNVVCSMMQPSFIHRRGSDKTDKDKTSDADVPMWWSIVLKVFGLGTLMAALVSTYLFIGFALFFACVMDMLRKLEPERELCQPMALPNCILRVTIVLTVLSIGLYMPHFREVMAIMSSICCSCNNVFFPLFFSLKLESDLGEDYAQDRTPHWRRIGHVCIFTLGLFCACLGLKDSVARLVREVSEGSSN